MASSDSSRPSARAQLVAGLSHPAAMHDLRGLSRLVIDAVTGVTDVVESMHRNIAGLSPVVGAQPSGRARGISGLVYRSVRGVTRAVGFTLDAVLGKLASRLAGSDTAPPPQREAVLAALNGVLGDYLAETESPLTIAMALRQGGRALTLTPEALTRDLSAAPGGRVLVLVHGLCMNDLQWTREGHDHGAALARDLGYTPLYLHYNTGRHIGTNGREFNLLLQQLLRAWPVPVKELVIVGHSMGGLVARSACWHAQREGHDWLGSLNKLVFLGTPHGGAPLERAGNGLELLLGVSPYSAPLVRLSQIRSAGIQDLRHGDFLSDETAELTRATWSTEANGLAGVACHAVAATTRAADGSSHRLPGDGLVPVKSALGQHRLSERSLSFAPQRQALLHGMNHFDLLSRPEVYQHLKTWLA